jgi:sulfite reductase (ferredoxin)
MIQYDLPASYGEEVNHYEESVRSYLGGSLNPLKFKAIRVPFGVYEQRKEGTFMVRVRSAAGVTTPEQMAVSARLAERYGNSTLHLTTRQGIQIHDVRLEDTVPIIRELASAGLSTRGTGGNTVRGIVASHDAGINPAEPFEVTPYAVALTSALIAEPDSWTLPRKYKIAFSNTADDTGEATAADLGFIAAERDGEKGFKVYIAGGLGRQARTGRLLYEFLPAERVYAVAAGLKRLFNNRGNRKNKHAARLRFLWEKLGERRFRELLDEEISAVAPEGKGAPSLDPAAPHFRANPMLVPLDFNSPEFETWKRRYVREQKQAGLYTIKVPFLMGDVRSEDALRLSVLLANFGEDTLRLSLDQNLHIRNIPGEYLGNVFDVIKNILSLSLEPAVIASLAACTGAAACKLGITNPKGALAAVRSALHKSALDLDALGDVRINISGCPNSCGRHQTADLGFYGKTGRSGGRLYPAYAVLAGGLARDRKARCGEAVGAVNAHDLPKFIVDTLTAYQERRAECPAFSSFVYSGCANRDGAKFIKDLSVRYAAVPSFEENKNYYFDWGAEELFSLDGRGEGECSAGMMDMIDADAKAIREGTEKLATLNGGAETGEVLYRIALSSSRMLLATKGLEPGTDQEVFEAFITHFIDKGLVPLKFRSLVSGLKTTGKKHIARERTHVLDLADAVLDLYNRMDDSLRLIAEAPAPENPPVSPFSKEGIMDSPPLAKGGEGGFATAVAVEPVKAKVFKDYRGVRCPINFVKVKLDLAAMHEGERLEVLLDDGDPIENVPRSVQNEGHEVISQRKVDGYWLVIIQKAQPVSAGAARRP